MDGDLGFYVIKPDQMQVINPLLILVFIPLYDVLFYPLLAKIGLRRPLQKLTLGGILAGVAFLVSGFVELELENTYPILPVGGESQLRIFNSMPCDYSVTTNITDHGSFIIKSIERFDNRYIPIKGDEEYFSYTLTASQATESCPSFEGVLTLRSAQANSFQIRRNGVVAYQDDPNKSRNGDPNVRVLANTAQLRSVTVLDLKRDRFQRFASNSSDISVFTTVASDFEILVDSTVVGEFSTKIGGVYTLIVSEGLNSGFIMSVQEITAPNSMSMLWLIPQYVIMTLGEVMYSVTGLAFSYAEAPPSMKAVIQACWLLTVAFGNVIDIIVVGAKAFDSQAYEFFLFAGLMFVDMLLFMLLAYRYKRPELAIEEENLISDESKANGKNALDNVAFDKKE